MYLFQISNYDDPAVDRETAELLHQHLEAESRRRCPAMWNATDRIRTHAAKGPAREKRTVRCRIYGVFLLALGLLTLILGLMPPRTTDVIIVGGAVIIAGLLEFALARGRTPPRIPASCKKEARKALELRRAVDWEKLKTAIRFEDAGITICAEENEEHLSYTRIVFVLQKQEVSRHGGKASDRRHNGAGSAAPRHQDRGGGEAAECAAAGSGL